MNNINIEESKVQRDLNEQDRKKCKYWVIGSTILYTILFPFFLLLTGMSFMVFGSPRIPTIMAFTVVSFFFCVPLSILVAIPLMWLNYFRKHYIRTRFFCKMPIFTSLFAFGAIQLLDTI